MPNPQVRIAFSGLCLFDFDPPLNGPVKPTQARVLLQRLTRARPLSRVVNSQPEVLDQHFPLLEFNLANWNPTSTRKPDFHCSPDSSGKMTKGVCLLNGEDLTLLPDSKEEPRQPLQLSRSQPGNTVDPQTDQDRNTLWWMATLNEIFPGNPLNPLIRDTSPASNQPVLARITLNQGWLKTRELTNSPVTIVGAGPSSFNRRVATAFELEIADPDKGGINSVEISMTRIRNGKKTASKLILNSVQGADVEIGITNMEIDRFIGMDPSDGPRAQADSEVFTDLLTRPIQGSKPFLLETAPGGSTGCCGHANCFTAGS